MQGFAENFIGSGAFLFLAAPLIFVGWNARQDGTSVGRCLCATAAVAIILLAVGAGELVFGVRAAGGRPDSPLRAGLNDAIWNAVDAVALFVLAALSGFWAGWVAHGPRRPARPGEASVHAREPEGRSQD
ncbi:MAG: hypothetical protein M3R38_09890 [Actinomycetota bacterium]|nr:hypothetical protein [Actinomycetota bacterium]